MVKTTKKVLVIIPCFNEAGRIGDVVNSIHRALPASEVVVIDDSSGDTTALEASRQGAVVLGHPCNLGYGAALETGYLHAVNGPYDILLQMDGDGQHLASELHQLLSPLEEGSADIVIGSRYLGGKAQGSTPLIRRAGHRFFSAILLLLSGRRIADPTSGFQGLNRKALEFLSSGVFPCDYPDSDVILMSLLAGLRVREVPVRMVERKGGTSMHSGLKPIYYGMKMMLSLFIVLLNLPQWRRWRRSHASAGIATEGS